MDPLRLITARAGFFTRQEAKAAGYADRAITRMVRRGAWLRFRRGAYSFRDEWLAMSDVQRHRVRSSAVLRSLGDAVALSHVSGVVRHGIDAWGLDLRRVHVTRLDGGPGRVEGDVVHHDGLAFENDVVLVGGQQVLRPERCVIEAGSRYSDEVALCLFDAGLRQGGFDRDQLLACAEQMQWWPFTRHLTTPLSLADGRSASVGESRGRWFFFAAGYPMPELQHSVTDPDGALVGITDWAWIDHAQLGEFDGEVKYGRLLKPGQQPGDVVFDEKVREDRLREVTGCGMLRIVWRDYSDLDRLRARVDARLPTRRTFAV